MDGGASFVSMCWLAVVADVVAVVATDVVTAVAAAVVADGDDDSALAAVTAADRESPAPGRSEGTPAVFWTGSSFASVRGCARTACCC